MLIDLDTTSLNRRELLLTAGVGLSSLLPLPAWSQEHAPDVGNDFWKRPRRIQLRHLNGDKIDSIYWSDGEIILSGYRELSHFMRDRRFDKAVYMNITVLDILYGINGWLNYFNIKSGVNFHSGFRTKKHNSLLEGAAKNSRHLYAQASDISIPGINTLQIAKFGLWLGGGGVGWYPVKNFVHLDTGTIRTWRG